MRFTAKTHERLDEKFHNGLHVAADVRSRDYQNFSHPWATISCYLWCSPINDEQHRKTLCDPSRSFKSHNLFLGWYFYGLCRDLNFLGDCAYYFLHSFSNIGRREHRGFNNSYPDIWHRCVCYWIRGFSSVLLSS